MSAGWIELVGIVRVRLTLWITSFVFFLSDSYGDATVEECKAADIKDETLTANKACCGCGGGYREKKQDKTEL